MPISEPPLPNRWALFCSTPFGGALTFGVLHSGRALNTFPLITLWNLKRKEPIPRREQVVIWYSGLRGAIAVALSLQVPGEMRDLLVATTMFIVLFTIFVLGGTTPSLLRRLRVPTGVPDYDEGAASLSRNEHRIHHIFAAVDSHIRSWIVDPVVAAKHDEPFGAGADLLLPPKPLRLLPQSFAVRQRASSVGVDGAASQGTEDTTKRLLDAD
jgi:hypothetical protein